MKKGYRLSVLYQLTSITTDECVLWPFPPRQDYARVRIGKKYVAAHRFACELRCGPPTSERNIAAHSCGVSVCVNPQHLRWATARENAADRLLHDTHLKGERNPAAKLTEAQVREIRRRADNGEGRSILAKEYGVHYLTIRGIHRREQWTSVA